MGHFVFVNLYGKCVKGEYTKKWPKTSHKVKKNFSNGNKTHRPNLIGASWNSNFQGGQIFLEGFLRNGGFFWSWT
jgi:hypothetical protein